MIELKNLSLQNGTFKLHDLNMLIPEGKYGALMGKTGCGKTTILEAICGLRSEVLSGQIILHDRDCHQLENRPTRNRLPAPGRRAIHFNDSLRKHCLCIAFAKMVQR